MKTNKQGFADVVTIAVIALVAVIVLSFGSGCAVFNKAKNKFTDGMTGKDYGVGDTPAFAADDVPFGLLV